MSKEKLLSALESADSKNNFNNAKVKKIREDFDKLRDRFLKPKIKEIRRNLYEIENKKNLSKSKIKEIEQNLIKLEESLLKLDKYYDYDDIEYKGTINIGNLFGEFDDEDYSKSIKTEGTFDDNYIEYESKGDKDKNLSLKGYLYIIIPYLRDIINTHKTLGEWKIQLSMKINFVSSKNNSDETHITSNWSDNIEIMMGSETYDIINELFEFFFAKISKRIRRINERK